VKDEDLPSFDEVPKEVQAKLDELDTKLEKDQGTLIEKYDAGDMQFNEFQSQNNALMREHQKEVGKIEKNLTIQQFRQRDEAKLEKAWDAKQVFFLRARREYIDKTVRGNALYGALVETVGTLSRDPRFSGRDREMDLLIEADRFVRETFGLAKPKEVKPGKGDEKPKEERPLVEVKPAGKLPDNKTLGDLPNAAPQTIGSVFDAITKLPGAEFEARLANMTEDQRRRLEDSLETVDKKLSTGT
jgi:hypothetical protein